MDWSIIKRMTVILLVVSSTVFIRHIAADDTSQAPHKKRVLIVNSYHKGLTWTDSIADGIEDELNASGQNMEIYSEYMDAKRYTGDEYYRELYKIYSYKFSTEKLDVVIVSDNDAFNFALQYHQDLFPGTPVVFCGINNFHESMLKGDTLFTGVVEEIDIKGTLDLILKLHPDVTEIVSVNDTTSTGRAIKSQVLEISQQFRERVSFEFIEDFDIEELKEKVWKLPHSSIILLSVVNRDRTGLFLDYEESIRLIYHESSIPIYSFWDTYLGKGIVGGRLTNGYHQGKTAAQLALRILEGENVQDIDIVMESPNKYMFDYQQLKLFDIAESDLPEDSIILNQPDTLYSRHKVFILTGVFTITSLILIIGVLLTIISYRKKMERMLRDSEERYRDFYENAPDMYHSVNKDGIIIYCNETEARMLGYTKEEMIGRPLSDFFTEKTRKIYEKEFPLLKNRRVHLDVEREFMRKDGSTFTASLNISTEVDENGELIKTKTICRDLTERRRVEELKRSQEQLRNLSAYLEYAREEEKKRIARQIHDELGHALTTLSLDLSWLNKRLSHQGEPLNKEPLLVRTHAMADLIDATIQTVQSISSELIPGVLDHLGLSEALKWQIDKIRERTSIQYNISIEPDNIVLEQKNAIAVFRIFQEALTNIVRHAEATKVMVILKEEEDRLTLEVKDNGKGIQERQITSPESVGLIGIRERARILGGTVSISAAPSGGTTVKLVIPANENREAQ